MTAKEMINKIIEEMPESVYTGTEEEREIKLALYVYVQLGKMKSVDEKIYWAKGNTIYNMIKEAKKDSKDLERLAKKRKLICISMANLYKKVLNILGITCEVRRGEPPDEHLDNIITLKSGRKIFADLQLDLYNIKTKKRLECFKAIGKDNFLNEYDLTHYLMNVGYIFDYEDYRENKIASIKNRVTSLLTKDALATILGSSEVYKEIEGLDVSEAYIYYRKILSEVLDSKKFNNIYEFPCYILDKNKEPNYFTFCIFADTGNYKTLMPYLYSSRYGRMLACDLKTLDQLQKRGLCLGASKFSRGRRKINNYIEQAKQGKKLREKMDLEK